MNVRFWYRYGTFIRKRYKEIYKECLKRGFKVEDNFNDEWSRHGGYNYNLDFIPFLIQLKISKQRIVERFEEKPDFYKYYGKPVDVQSYNWALEVNNPKWIKNRKGTN